MRVIGKSCESAGTDVRSTPDPTHIGHLIFQLLAQEHCFMFSYRQSFRANSEHSLHLNNKYLTALTYKVQS